MVRAAAAALASAVRSVEESRPACLAAAYDLEMKLIGPDGGDGLRDYLRQVGSSEVHPLLTGWLDKLEPYRTDLAGLARILGGIGCLSRGDDPLPARLRCDSLPGLHPRRAASRRIHPRREFSRLQPHHGVQRGGMAGRGGALRRIEPRACRSRCRWRRLRGAKISHCAWRSGWRKPSADGSRRLYLAEPNSPGLIFSRYWPVEPTWQCSGPSELTGTECKRGGDLSGADRVRVHGFGSRRHRQRRHRDGREPDPRQLQWATAIRTEDAATPGREMQLSARVSF